MYVENDVRRNFVSSRHNLSDDINHIRDRVKQYRAIIIFIIQTLTEKMLNTTFGSWARVAPHKKSARIIKWRRVP